MEQTILIKNVRIFNGTDEKTVMGDILIPVSYTHLTLPTNSRV